jgi:4-hydroxy-tetrahydrodipicolinate reductase
MMRVVINGVSGQMGSYLFNFLKEHDQIEIVACISRNKDLDIGVKVYDTIESCLNHVDFDTLIDFTAYPICLDVVKTAILNQKNVVSGTTGYKKYDGQHIGYLANKHQVGVIISPNFSLMDKALEEFLVDNKEKFPYRYISETHSLHKIDKPSGTAVYLAKLLDIKDENVHSTRIPGIIASHTILFSDLNQRLELTHTINNRDAFIKGIEQAVKDVTKEKRINLMI